MCVRWKAPRSWFEWLGIPSLGENVISLDLTVSRLSFECDMLGEQGHGQ